MLLKAALILICVLCATQLFFGAKGVIQGNERLDKDGRKFHSFTGIPYAKPPIGALRFKAPVPADPWYDSLDATKEAPVCVQYEFETLIGSEDCLYLNVYTPNFGSDDDVNKELLPVMFFIHGGGYFEGSGNPDIYGPEFLVSQNVVLVTFNYRLGPFGSLSFEDQTLGVPGNAHLKDQVLALKWVQRYIHRFGGDKSSVTIFGCSVGAASVHMHLLSPMSKGLFHKAIAESGSALSAWNAGVLGTGRTVAEKLGIRSKSDKEIIGELQKVPTDKVMETQTKDGLMAVPVHVPLENSPVVEKQTNEPAFLPDLPINILKSGHFSKLPFIIGYNSNDTVIFQVVNRLYNSVPFFITDFNKVIPHNMNVPNKDKATVRNDIRQKFYGDSGDDISSIEKFMRLTLGPWCISAVKLSADLHIKSSNSPLYIYRFSGDTKLNFFKRLHPVTATYKGASHMDELGHLFKTKYTPDIEKGSVEEKTQMNILKLWTNFARYGNPTPENNGLGVTWKPVNKEELNYLDISDVLKPGVKPDDDIVSFWHPYYEKYCGV